MKVYLDLIQGSTEWLNLRSGIPTSSEFDRILTPKGNLSGKSTREKYRDELLAERIMGHPRVEAMSRWMDRGSQMEAEAVAFYQFQREVETEKVGFITNDAGTIGCSPDRRVVPIESKRLLEIKCPSEGVHVAYLLADGGAYDAYRVQTQGQLWVAEADVNDLVSFHPEMPYALHAVERDDKFIALLKEAVEEFSADLEAKSAELKDRRWIK